MCCLDFMVDIKQWSKARDGYKIYLSTGEVMTLTRKEFRNQYLDDSDFAKQVRDVVELAFKKHYGL